MKLVVGLGNPGRKYEATRHNVGYDVIARLVREHGLTSPRQRFHGECWEVKLAGENCLLLCPTTFMNLSGKSVAAAVAFYQVATDDVLVVCDDFHLPLGKLRFRSKGSAGGQKGLGDIIRQLGTDAVPRLRIGVGSPPDGWEAADYVLSRFAKDEQFDIAEACNQAAAGVQTWVEQGIEPCMNQYN